MLCVLNVLPRESLRESESNSYDAWSFARSSLQSHNLIPGSVLAIHQKMGQHSQDFLGTERFRIRRRLGSGGMGVVYEAHDRETDKVVALKTLTRAEASHISRFKNEFRSLADVSHPNLVALYEFMADGQDWFFTMELVQGINFLEYVRPGYQARKVQSSRTPTLRKTSKDPSDELLADYEAETQQLDSDRGNYESSDSVETPEES